MTTRPVLAQCILKSTSGLSTDVYVTDWAFDYIGAGSDQDIADGIAALLANSFWNHAGGAGEPCAYLSPGVASTVVVNVFDLTGHLDGSPHGSPIATQSFALGLHTTAGILPEECAIALSFHADLSGLVEKQVNPMPPPAFIRPAARRRGRVFLGPWTSNTVAGPIGGRARIILDLQNRLLDAAAALLVDSLAVNLVWSVWSRTEADLFQIVGGFLDDAWDTIRSRGAEPTGRTNWP